MPMRDLGVRTARITHSRFAVPVTYTRTDGTTAALNLRRTNPLHETADPDGMQITDQSDDWLCIPADFTDAFGGSALPEDDDRVTVDGRNYRVRPVGGDPCWRWSKDRAFLRIHSKDEGAA